MVKWGIVCIWWLSDSAENAILKLLIRSLKKCMSHRIVAAFSGSPSDVVMNIPFLHLYHFAFYAHRKILIAFQRRNFNISACCACSFMVLSANQIKFLIWPQWASHFFRAHLSHMGISEMEKEAKPNNVTHFASGNFSCFAHVQVNEVKKFAVYSFDAKSSVNNWTKLNGMTFRSAWECECVTVPFRQPINYDNNLLIYFSCARFRCRMVFVRLTFTVQHYMWKKSHQLDQY